MSAYEKLKEDLSNHQYAWLVTGAAGFIGSNLVESLLKLNQRVVGLDNFSTGFQKNLDEIEQLVSTSQWQNFQFMKGDIRNLEDCKAGMIFNHGEEKLAVQFVLHQAALGSVPRSFEDPINTNASNIDGFLNMLVAARDAKVKRFVFAASSSTYGDHPALPKVEDQIGKPLSPYAVTKYVNELYADVFARTYGLNFIGLRYFNVFGKRQDSNGAYAAVIAKWIDALIKNQDVYINGDGETSRDFCCIENAVQANLLAATTENPEANNQIFNVAVGDRTSLNQLYALLKENLEGKYSHVRDAKPIYRDYRGGDVRHSQANITKAKSSLGYEPYFKLEIGLRELINSLFEKSNKSTSNSSDLTLKL